MLFFVLGGLADICLFTIYSSTICAQKKIFFFSQTLAANKSIKIIEAHPQCSHLTTHRHLLKCVSRLRYMTCQVPPHREYYSNFKLCIHITRTGNTCRDRQIDLNRFWFLCQFLEFTRMWAICIFWHVLLYFLATQWYNRSRKRNAKWRDEGEREANVEEKKERERQRKKERD